MEATTTIVRDKREKKTAPVDEEESGVQKRVKTRHSRGPPGTAPAEHHSGSPFYSKFAMGCSGTYIVNSVYIFKGC
jgi:hypothetical protein